MTHIRGQSDADLHHDNGEHRATAATADGRAVALHEDRIKRHLEAHRAKCNALFCILETHDGDRHVDVTGHTWTEPTPENEVIAHVYSWDET